MRRVELCALLALALLPGAARAQGTPLDVTNPTARAVFVQMESSSNLAVVGQSFGPPFPATWSVSGNTGTVTISAETFEEMLGIGMPPVPESFTPVVIEIDRTSLEATSQVASAGYHNGSAWLTIELQALDTTATGGFVGPTAPPLFCQSQQQVDEACQFFSVFCGQTCTLVPGSPYDPATGRVNLIGVQVRDGCDGTLCPGALYFFTPFGDLRVTDSVEIPMLPGGTAFVLLAALGACARAVIRKE